MATATAREALIIEAIGEMAAVVNRVEALVPKLQDTRQSLIDANAQLGGLPISPHDDGSDSLLWFAMCAGFWPLMLASVVYAKTRKSLPKQH